MACHATLLSAWRACSASSLAAAAASSSSSRNTTPADRRECLASRGAYSTREAALEACGERVVECVVSGTDGASFVCAPLPSSSSFEGGGNGLPRRGTVVRLQGGDAAASGQQ